MARILIVYGTTEGHTRSVARRLAATVMAHGHTAVVDDATEAHVATDGYDACIVCASIHQGRHQAAVAHFVRANLSFLDGVPTAFFSVSLTAALPDAEHQAEARSLAEAFARETGWRPGHIFLVAGALKYTEYDFMKRLLMRLIAQRRGGDTDTSRDFEYTDWQQLREDTAVFLSASRLAMERRVATGEMMPTEAALN